MREWKENWELRLLAVIMAALVWIFVKLGGGRKIPGTVLLDGSAPRTKELAP